MKPSEFRQRSDPPVGQDCLESCDSPYLESSSDSSSCESDGPQSTTGREQLSARTRSLMDFERNPHGTKELTRSYLASVSRLNGYASNSRLDCGPLETRSSISSPGRTSSLRGRLNRLSRYERKDLFIQTDEKALAPRDSESSGLNPLSPEHRRGHGLKSIVEESIVRLKQKAQLNPRKHQRQANRVSLNIYDLIAKDTLMRLPWGCMCEIGKCFNEMNTALHELGTGAYHVGIEVNGVEYAFGATSTPGRSGVFSCIPKLSPGYQYRTTIDFGEIPLKRRRWVPVDSATPNKPGTDYKELEEFVDGRKIIKEMVPEYMGTEYDILRKNCCTFARDACIRLGVKEEAIPSWFGNLAQSGAMTQDVAYSVTQPLLSVLSSQEEKTGETDDDTDDGFEVVASRNENDDQDVVLVMPASPSSQGSELLPLYMRRTITWA